MLLLRNLPVLGGVALVLVIAGCGGDEEDPKLAADVVAMVEETPREIGMITEVELERGIEEHARTVGVKVPSQGTQAYTKLAKRTLSILLEEVWTLAEAEELGLSIPGDEISAAATRLKRLASGNGSSREPLSRSDLASLENRLRWQRLRAQIERVQRKSIPDPSDDEVEEFFAEEKEKRFSEPARADIRIIFTRDRADSRKAATLLQRDNSPASWTKVAAQYSEDRATGTRGGLREDLVEGEAVEPLNTRIFSARTGRVEGPVATDVGYAVFEVNDRELATTQGLTDFVRVRIEALLKRDAEKDAADEFLKSFHAKWTDRTLCAPEYANARCADEE
jgi:hypothetical protein